MALRTSATGEYLSRTANLPTGTGPYTVMFWFQRVNDNAEDNQPFFSLEEATTPSGLVLKTWYDLGIYCRQLTAGDNYTDVQLLSGDPTTSTWYWLAYAQGNDKSYSVTCSIVSGSPSWSSSSWTYDVVTPTGMYIGAGPTFGSWVDSRFLAFKCWDTKLTTGQMESERYYYDPQVTSNVRMWTPLITESSDHSVNGYNWTEVGSISWEAYEPSGMNPLGGTGSPGSIWPTITL